MSGSRCSRRSAPNGYPKRIWDKLTGEIDHEVAKYWREHYDLSHILQRDWTTLAPQLDGKLRIYVGDMDNFYLNNAVYKVEEFLKKADPPAHGGGGLRRSRRALLERRPHARRTPTRGCAIRRWCSRGSWSGC